MRPQAVASSAATRTWTFGSYIEDLLRGETVIVDDLRTDPRTAGDGAAALEAIGIRTLVNVPILGRGQPVAIAFVYFAQQHGAGGRMQLAGPGLLLGPKAALTLSLIVHELATNAAKHGALSGEDGHVEVSWADDVDSEMQRPNLSWVWREVGGPKVIPPERKSFGTRLIEMGIAGSAEGSSEIDYAPRWPRLPDCSVADRDADRGRGGNLIGSLTARRQLRIAGGNQSSKWLLNNHLVGRKSIRNDGRGTLRSTEEARQGSLGTRISSPVSCRSPRPSGSLSAST